MHIFSAVAKYFMYYNLLNPFFNEFYNKLKISKLHSLQIVNGFLVFKKYLEL